MTAIQIPTHQTAIVQSNGAATGQAKGAAMPLPLTISHTSAMPQLPPPAGHVLIRVLAVALNPTDFKMPIYLSDPGSTAGLDYCGVVMALSPEDHGSHPHTHRIGDRICGNVFAYNPAVPLEGTFAQFAIVDARMALVVPESWSDTTAAALGGTGWKTTSLGLWDDKMLGLEGRPSRPVSGAKSEPVLVYGGATASGTMAMQLLKHSGYRPIAITSPASASLARQYGAVATASYLSSSVIDDARAAASADAANNGSGTAIRHALDCIANEESVATCFGAIARRGGNYACLENLDPSWATRKAVRVGVVMAYETTGLAVYYSPESPYNRDANPERLALGIESTKEVQLLVDAGKIVPHPVREIKGGWEGIIKGVEMLRSGKVSGEKLVVRIPQSA